MNKQHWSLHTHDFRNNRSQNNLVTPEMLVNQLWMQEEDTNGVKIIELNSSSDSDKESSVNFHHAWSYVNNDRFVELDEDNYKVNEEARRRRRTNLNYNENNLSDTYENQYYFDHDMQSNSNAFYDTYDSGINGPPLNHQINCFTIINNQNAKSDSSTDSENYETMEVIEIDNSEKKYWDHVYNEEVITYDPHTQTEKRTIWIYSYKNKRFLSDNDFELVNIPCKETASSSSISDEEQIEDKTTNTCRVGSPVPTTYIPRLDLSLVQTLSTVTELSEPNKSRSKESSREMINLKPRNNWLTDTTKQMENSNVVNWMALSPRERRRRFVNTNFDIISKEGVKDTKHTYAERIAGTDPMSNRSRKVESSIVQVKVDIHANEKETYRESNNEPEPDEIKKMSYIFPMQISFADADCNIDTGITEIDYANKPSIQINTKLNTTKITEPIEKLNCCNWISEECEEKETTVYDYDLASVAEVNVEDSSSENAINSASKRLWIKSMQLMKPPQWTEYLPITCSMPSIHLSLSINSLNGKRSWFRRLAKCIKCCK